MLTVSGIDHDQAGARAPLRGVTGPLWARWREGRLGVDRVLPISTAEHVLRVLIGEGKRGAEILGDLTWRIFLCTPNDVADVLTRLSQTRLRREQRRRLHGRHSVWAAHATTQAVWVAQQARRRSDLRRGEI